MLGLVLWGALGGVGLPTARAAEPARARLEVALDADAGCPEPSVLMTALVTRLGYDPVRADAELLARVRVSRGALRLSGAIVLSGPDGRVQGRREVEGRAGECGALVETLAFALSMALDADAASRPHPPRRPRDEAAERRGDATLEAAARAPAQAGSVPEAAARASPGELGVGLRVAFGEAPAPSGGLVVSGRLLRGAFVGGLELGGAWPAGRTLDGTRVRVSAAHLAALPCARAGWFRACGLGRLGFIVAAADGLEPSRRGLAATAALGLRVGLVAPVSRRLALELSAESTVALLRTTLRVDDGAVWRTPRFAAAAALALSWRLPR
jgi:hypothetical protein